MHILPDDVDRAASAALVAGYARDLLCQAVAALDAAELAGQPFAMVEAHHAVAEAYGSMFALQPAASHLEQALRWARLTGSPDLVVDLQCQLCETLVRCTEDAEPEVARRLRESARDHAFAAAMGARHVADPQWEIKVLLRISDALDRCGDHADAASLQVRALSLMVGEPTAEARMDAAVAGARHQ